MSSPTRNARRQRKKMGAMEHTLTPQEREYLTHANELAREAQEKYDELATQIKEATRARDATKASFISYYHFVCGKRGLPAVGTIINLETGEMRLRVPDNIRTLGEHAILSEQQESTDEREALGAGATPPVDRDMERVVY